MTVLTGRDDLSELRFDERGLIPTIAQDVGSGAVLMMAWADREAVEKTLESGDAWFWSRSRGELWKKGATSGNVLRVGEVRADCDGDTLLYRVRPAGPACHTGTRTCFEGASPDPARLELGWLAAVLEERRSAPPESSYTARLLAKGLPRIAQKVGEEATETIVAALAEDDDELIGEAADLLYHLLVLLTARGIGPERVADRLAERHGAKAPTPEESR